MWRSLRGALRCLGVKVCRRSVLLVVLLWLASWLFLNGLVFVHRNMFSDFCTDDKSKEILQRVVRVTFGIVQFGIRSKRLYYWILTCQSCLT